MEAKEERSRATTRDILSERFAEKSAIFLLLNVIICEIGKKYAKKLPKNLVKSKKNTTFAPFKLKYITWQTRKWLLQRQFFYCSDANIEGYCRIPCALAVMARNPCDNGLNSR